MSCSLCSENGGHFKPKYGGHFDRFFQLIIANRKNKLFAYFFTALDDRSLIVEDWQSLSARKSLFLSYNGTLLKQNNISTAVKDSREKPPKDCHIIDKYIKQLKKD